MRAALTNALLGFLSVIAAAICFSCCDANSNVLCIESEREALLKLKNDLNDPSNSLSSWVETEDCCKWIGVFCNNLTGHVTRPEDDAPFTQWEAYEQSKLGGTINPSLLQLKHLTSLDLSNNSFSSIQIPEFDEVRSLQWVSGLSSLQYLDLSEVHLHKATDWLQVTFNLPNLLELHLSDCLLQDDTSPISIVNSRKSLAVLDLYLNQFSSIPMSIFSLHGLVSLNLSFNSLNGPIPDYFGNTSFLEVVDLSSNSLNSSIPNSLYSLHHLQSLSLGGNYFQGEISSAIGNLSSLIHLDLSHNKFQRRLPTSFEDLCKLKEMNLSSNEIDQDISEILRSLSRCSLDCLESLNMAKNQLSGHLTDQLGKFENLAYLSLAQNKIYG
ncbi:hypothetical protein V6N11_079747 [Hibiscus sabdariffa]|uniref:Leucine-rich repeat-containing N-terminal plant-type domain-containing protein n=1 Tax=Hibiscus sabdariffa TaxID=183260 RepID=A0ABR2RWI5_9ROSI